MRSSRILFCTQVMAPRDMNDDTMSNMPGAGQVFTYAGDNQPLVPMGLDAMGE